MGETRTFSLVPTPGQGLITALSDHSVANFPQSYKSLRDVVVRDNSFQAMNAHGLIFLRLGATTPVWAVHYFNTSATATYKLYHCGGLIDAPGTANLLDGAGNVVLTTSQPHELVFLNIKNRCFIAGQTIDPTWGPWVIDSDGTTNYQWGRPGPAGELAYTPLGKFTNTTTKQFYNPDAVLTITKGDATVTCTDASFVGPVPADWAGAHLTVFINSTTTAEYTIDTVTDSGNLELTTSVTEDTATGKAYLVSYGAMKWGILPPQYSYAYYNPTTGHCTNGSPVTKISENNQVSVNVELLNIQGTNDLQFTHIVLFRTTQDGQPSLLPMTLDPAHGGTADIETAPGISQYMILNNYTGTRTYIDALSDRKRGVDVLGNFPVPLDLNNEAPSDIKYMAYSNGQIFYTRVEFPWRLYYTRRTRPEQLGVGEESFPEQYHTDLSADNGYITGLRQVGDATIVCTDKYLYVVEGAENAHILTRLSARGSGVSHWAIDEHPGDSTTNTASAIYVSRDRRLWRHWPGGQIQDLGAPIQNFLDEANLDGARPFHARVCMVDRYQFLALGILRPDGTYYDFYFFDFDTNEWFDFGFSQNSGGGQPGWCVGTGLDFNTHLGGASIGLAINNAVFELMTSDLSPSLPGNPTANGETHFLDFGDWTSKKSLQGIYFYTDDLTADTDPTEWKCLVRFDSTTSAYIPLTRLALSGSPRDLGPGTFFWDVKALGPRQWHSIQLQWFIGGAGITTKHKLHRVEIVYTLESTGSGGKP